MTKSGRIVLNYEEHDAFLNRTCENLEINYAKYGFDEETKDAWLNLRTQWEPKFLLYSDKNQSRTTVVIEELRECIDNCKELNNRLQILNRIASCTESRIEDLVAFNIKAGPTAKSHRTIPTTPIDALVIPHFTPKGGGRVYIRCKNSNNERTRIVEGATHVECRYSVGEELPSSVEDTNLDTATSTHASFTLPLGTSTSGKTLFIYMRWASLKHPELSGPWSEVYYNRVL